MPNLPKNIGPGVLWILAAAAFAMWTGWLQPPWERVAEERRHQEEADKLSRDQATAIYLLQYQRQETINELNRINARLDELSMVVNSMERRTAPR